MMKRKISFELFVGVWNTQANLATPRLHKRMASWLARRSRQNRKKLLLMAFRGSGKSTLTGLYCAWALCHNPELRILVVAADENLAENMVRHVRNILETHLLARCLMPDKLREWARDRLTVRRKTAGRDPSLRAAGISSNITGSRADIIICDDVEVPKTADTSFKRTELRAKLAELDFILVPDGMILYIGTPHAEDSLYKKNGTLKDYARLSIPLSENVWPERFTPRVISELQKSVGASVYASQMMLEPVPMHAIRLDPAKLVPYDDTTEIRIAAKRCAWDPAFGGADGDRSIVALVLFDNQRRIYLHDLVALHSDTDDNATTQCRMVADFLRAHGVKQIIVENNGIGQFLPGLLRKTLREENIQCAVQPHHNSKSKVTRILAAFEAPLAASAVHIHPRVQRSILPAQMREWRPDDREAEDDALDATASAILAAPSFSGAGSTTPHFLKGDPDDFFI
jgi:hypothetical protein